MTALKLDESRTKMFAAFLISILIISPSLATVCTVSALDSTSLFEDDFESGSFSKWNGVNETPGERARVRSILPHHGVYSAFFSSNGSMGYENAYSYATVGSSEVYVRGYFYLDRGLPLYDIGERFYLMRLAGAGANLLYVGICRIEIAPDQGVDRWIVVVRNGSSWMNTIYADDPIDPLPQIGQWYCIELHWKMDSLAGVVELYINGVQIIEIGGLDTSRLGNAAELDFGLIRISDVGHWLAIYSDCIVVSKTYVGLSCSPIELESPGDTNNDGIINLLDLAHVARIYLSYPGDPNWDPSADLNGDGVVNLLDLAIVATNYNAFGQPTPSRGLIIGTDIWSGTTRTTFFGDTHLPLMKQCGIQMVRLEFNRGSVANLRTLVPAITGNGIEVLGLLMRRDLSADISTWGTWVYDTVNEFKQYVHVWEIWNEPNLDQYFDGADPVRYTNFLKFAYQKAKQADPSCKVLGGSIVFTQRSSLNFLTTMYQNGAKDYMDGLAYHPYCHPYSPDNTAIANAFIKVDTHVRPIMTSYGDYNPIWITEVGWGTDDLSEQRQADYIVRALEIADSWSYVEAFIIYNWIDSPGFYKGLLRNDGRLKLSFNAVKNFTGS